MPWQTVMHRFKAGDLHSGSKKGPKVTSRAQAVAVMLSEKKKGEGEGRESKAVKGLKDAHHR